MKIEIDISRINPTFLKVYLTALFLVPTGIVLFRNFGRTSDETPGYSIAEDIFPKLTGSYEYGFFDKPKDDVEPEIPARDAVWQPVERRRFFVYSAFYDDRREWSKMVQVISMTKAFRRTPARCTFWHANRRSSRTRAKVKCRERSNTRYTLCFVQCPFVSEEIPYSVSITTKHHSTPMNRLLVVDARKYEDTAPTTIGVCVTPLRHFYNDSIQLVEFMELNEILGLSHVTFYKASISITTECILRSYVDEGRATVLLWNDFSRFRSLTTTDTAAINDCMYRNMDNFTHIAFLSTDEFIMPGEADTIQEMIDNLDQKRLHAGYEIASYNFRSGLFYVVPSSISDASNAFEKSLNTLVKTHRREDLYPHGIKSRYIVKPTKVLELGNHLVRKFVNDYNRLAVPESEGIINSYTKSNVGAKSCDLHSLRKDTTASRYKNQLVAAVKTRWRQLQEKCEVEDIQKQLQYTTLPPSPFKYSKCQRDLPSSGDKNCSCKN